MANGTQPSEIPIKSNPPVFDSGTYALFIERGVKLGLLGPGYAALRRVCDRRASARGAYIPALKDQVLRPFR